MDDKQDRDFSLEKQLRDLDPELHRRFTDAVVTLQFTLSKYKLFFPEYTDHTILHSMSVADFCNRLAGSRVKRLNADEIYILLMSCYLHDTGMGIPRNDYEEFCTRIDFGDYFETHTRDDIPALIRDFHHEFSGEFIRKYAEFLEIPSPGHEWAIIQVCRGHRKTDLLDEKEYPVSFALPNGNTVCLPYLAALIRLADEIDVAAARNPVLLYDIETLADATQIVENKKIRAIRRLAVSDDAFTLEVSTKEKGIQEEILKLTAKMQNTLDTCRNAVTGRTPFTISQEKILLKDRNKQEQP